LGVKSALKVETSSFDIAAVVYELDQKIKNARIENIYQTSPTTILLRLHQQNQPTLQLLMEAGKRFHLTSYATTKPLNPPAYCMALRKHLKNGKISSIQQQEFERIITLSINTKEGVFKLVTELFGAGNIILINPLNIILYALTYRKMRDRNILRGEKFSHAPSIGKNPLSINRREFDEVKKYGQLEIVRALTKFLSIGGLYAEEILQQSEVNKNIASTELTEQKLDNIFTNLNTLLSKIITGKFEPSIVVDERGEWVDIIPIRLVKYSNLSQKVYKSFNEALDEYYTKTRVLEKVSTVEREVESELTKHLRMLQDQRKTFEDLREAIKQNKKIGDLIYSHLDELQLLIQKILEEKEKNKTWEQITSEIEQDKQLGKIPAIYFHSLDPKPPILNVLIEDAIIQMNLKSSVQANAASFYERMKKSERKIEGDEKALHKTEDNIRKLQEVQVQKAEKVREEAPLKRRERAWYEKFRWFHSSNGFLIIGGRDATTNEILIKKYLEPNDIVFHAEVVGAPFVIVKSEEKNVPEQTLKEVAQFAASYSRAWLEMLSRVNVYWVNPDQIDKTPPHGQYLKKGSFRIHGTKNYIKNIPLRVAIGIQKEDDQILVIGGPAEAVQKWAIAYEDIIPGEESSAKLAKLIRYLLSKKVKIDWQKKISEIPIEEIQQFIPLGKGAIASASKM
jgi:predicted ribosome quality control (RQC) complex YloA/Tae2 family protein